MHSGRSGGASHVSTRRGVPDARLAGPPVVDHQHEHPGHDSHRLTQLSQIVAEGLRGDIYDGRLRPGTWLRQDHIARQHGVSPVPVREALKQLAAEGLLAHEPYRGFRVITYSAREIGDLYDCRAILEAIAARGAAGEITDAEIAELDELRGRMEQCSGPEGLATYRVLNRRFHSTIASASRRPFLMRIITQLWSSFPTMLWAALPQTATGASMERESRDNEQHARVLEALRAHDAERAGQAMQEHIEDARRDLLASMREPRSE